MNRYQAVQAAVAADPVLASLGLQATYRGQAVGDPTEDVFAVVVWGASATEAGFREAPYDPQTVTVWFYQPPGGYSTVSPMLARLRAVMVGLEGTDGVGQVTVVGDSGDLYDDRWGRATRNGTYTLH